MSKENYTQVKDVVSDGEKCWGEVEPGKCDGLEKVNIIFK